MALVGLGLPRGLKEFFLFKDVLVGRGIPRRAGGPLLVVQGPLWEPLVSWVLHTRMFWSSEGLLGGPVGRSRSTMASPGAFSWPGALSEDVLVSRRPP